MKKRLGLAGLGLLIISLCFTSCIWDWNPTYTVYIEDRTYSDDYFRTMYGNDSLLNDGEFVEITIDNFNVEVSMYSTNARQYLTADEIRDVFVSFGYGEQESREATRWLLSYERDHALVVNRTGNIAHFVLR